MPINLSSVRDLLLPALERQVQKFPGLDFDIRVDFLTDNLLLGFLFKGTLVQKRITRKAIDDGMIVETYHQLVDEALMDLGLIAKPVIMDEAEYNEIIAGQEIMDDLLRNP